MRAIRSLIVAALVLASLAGFARAAADDETKPTTSFSDRADPFFGIISQRLMDADDFDQMKWGRLGSFRLPVPWGAIEANGDGNMDWEMVDNVVEQTARRGIALLPTLYASPSWLYPHWQRLPLDSPEARTKWKQFIRKAVDRYGTNGTFWLDHPQVPYAPVRQWQIWNEPNIVFFARPVSGRAYAKLLRMSAGVIHNRDPQARVVTAGFYGRPPPGKGIPAGGFLKRMYKVPGARKSFDVVAVHPYAITLKQSWKRTWKVRVQMNRHRDRRKKMVITELGWGSDEGAGFGLGSMSAQADRLRAAYRMYLSQRRRLRLSSIYWFSWSDVDPDSRACSFCRETGLFDYTGKPKPTWYRLLDFTHNV